jgi:hypothetical protein
MSPLLGGNTDSLSATQNALLDAAVADQHAAALAGLQQSQLDPLLAAAAGMLMEGPFGSPAPRTFAQQHAAAALGLGLTSPGTVNLPGSGSLSQAAARAGLAGLRSLPATPSAGTGRGMISRLALHDL